MSGTKKVLCRYFVSGCCKFGEACKFSHDKNDSPSNVCKYYLQGNCSYGDKCRYEHAKPDYFKAKQPKPKPYTPPPAVRKPESPKLDNEVDFPAMGGLAITPKPATPAATSTGASPKSDANPATDVAAEGAEPKDAAEASAADSATEERAAEDVPAQADDALVMYFGGNDGDDDGEEARAGSSGTAESSGSAQEGILVYGEGEGEEGLLVYDDDVGAENDAWVPAEPEEEVTDPADTPLCQAFSSFGSCAKGESCLLVHGEACELCNKFCIHPYNAEQAATHRTQCAKRQASLAARARAANMECGICLEKVMSKTENASRKFGLLLKCDHAFCLTCIRDWRNKADRGDNQADVGTSVRTCPVCRVKSHYVTPSTTWPETKEAKAKIIAGYKAHIGDIHCKHFNRGRGFCPFGTSCFYKHALPDGTLQDRTGKALRKVGTADGDRAIVQPARLCDFIELQLAGRAAAAIAGN